jgi:hypothetical protein
VPGGRALGSFKHQLERHRTGAAGAWRGFGSRLVLCSDGPDRLATRTRIYRARIRPEQHTIQKVKVNQRRAARPHPCRHKSEGGHRAAYPAGRESARAAMERRAQLPGDAQQPGKDGAGDAPPPPPPVRPALLLPRKAP